MVTQQLRPEDQMLVCLARRVIDAGATEQIRELLRENDLEWEYLMAAANRHGLGNLLSFQLLSLTDEPIPEEVNAQLRSDYQESTKYCLSLASALTRILESLAEQGVQSVPFKGPTLALLAYGDVGLRQFADLDLLIHKCDVPRVKGALSRCGFTPTYELSPSLESALLRFSHAYSFENKFGIFLDVQWDFLEPHFGLAIDSKPMWARRKPVRLGGKEILTFEPEDLLFILCIHGFSHWWERLGWICDVAGLVSKQQDLDWEAVFQRAQESGTVRILSLGLLLASELLNARLPPEVSKAIAADLTVRSVAARIETQLFNPRQAEGILDGMALRIGMRERKLDRLRSLFRAITTPNRYDWMYTSLPNSLSFLYYLIRPIRLLGKYGPKLIKNAFVSSASTEDRRQVLP